MLYVVPGSVQRVFFSLMTFSLKLLARPLAWGRWNCSAALRFRVRYSVMGRQNYFTGCLSALLMDIRSKNSSLYDFPMLKDMGSLSYWVCLLFSNRHGTKIYAALCHHTKSSIAISYNKIFLLVFKSPVNEIPLGSYTTDGQVLVNTEKSNSLQKELCDLSRLPCLQEPKGLRWLKTTFLGQIQLPES